MTQLYQGSIEDVLEEWGFLSGEQKETLRDTAIKSGKTVDEILLNEHIVPEEQFYRAKGKVLGIPYVNLAEMEIQSDAVSLIPSDVSKNYNFLAFAKDGNTLHVAMVQPDDFQALEALKFLTKNTGLRTEIHITSSTAISEAISKVMGGISGEVESAIREFNEELEGVKKEVDGGGDRDVEKIVGEAPVTKAVAVILRHGIEGKASDVHIEPSSDNLRVRFRVDGLLYTSLLLPLKLHSSLISRIKILSNLKIDEQRLPQDGRFSSSAGGHEYDIRVSILPTVYGEKIVLRILDKSEGAVPFEKLGYNGRRLENLKDALARPYGLILLTGPTGSGKSTTLYTAIDSICDPTLNVVTLEDPVEYRIAGANQSQTNSDINFTFANGLRSILRQDPDTIMVGEVRDKETAELVVHAALTGHLVLSTLHTNDALGAIARLIDMGLEPFLLAAVLRLVGAQRLVRRLCNYCKKEIPIPDEFRDIINKVVSEIPESEKTEENQKNPKVLYEAAGCKECGGKGTKGRFAIVEIIPVIEEIRQAIARNETGEVLYKIAVSKGLISMRQDGFLKVLSGVVSLREVLEATSED
jgi:type IV pilus assembly protein PilB